MKAHDEFMLKNGFVVICFRSSNDTHPIWHSHAIITTNETITKIVIFSKYGTTILTLHGLNWNIRLTTIYHLGNDYTVPFVYQTPPE
jgi:hypothetical protein